MKSMTISITDELRAAIDAHNKRHGRSRIRWSEICEKKMWDELKEFGEGHDV
jgi:hypothetical protein